MGILRNGIMKEYGMSPEKKIELMMKKPGVNGIGVAPALLAIIPKLIELIAKIFKKKPKVEETLTENDVPADDDFLGVATSSITALANKVRSQSDAVEPGESLTTYSKSSSAPTASYNESATYNESASAPTASYNESASYNENASAPTDSYNESTSSRTAEAIPPSGGRKLWGIC